MKMLESRSRSLGREPVVTIYESCSRARRMLDGAGYRKVDTMTVMVSTGHCLKRGTAEARIDLAQSSENWSDAYLLAFYGDLELAPEVRRVAERLQKMDSTTLLEARRRGEVAGVLAIFRTEGLAGVYCVCTVPRFRRTGIAGMLLERAKEIVSSEGRILFLQVLESDRTEPFYRECGFKVLYRKLLMQKS